MSVTFEQFKELKNVDMVFATVVKNDDLLRETQDIIQALQAGGQPRGLPRIKSLDDVYKVGVICQAKATEEKQNPFAPVCKFLL